MTERHSTSDGIAPTINSDLDWALREVSALQKQLDTLRDELIWCNRLTTLGTMSAVLAHEYNNLLTPIGSYAQLALSTPGDAVLIEKALRAAVEGVEQAKKLSHATLGFARPEETGRAMQCGIDGVIQKALACTDGILRHAAITCQIDVPDARISTSALSMQQVLVNLIQNAANAMTGQRGVRRISLTGRIGDGDFKLELNDTGPGIADEVLKQLFEPFVTHPVGEGGAPGTGLGLRVCKELVEAAGGTITAESRRGEGATFRLILPLATGM